MSAPKAIPRTGMRFACIGVLAACIAAPAGATDLRGRVELKAREVTVEVRSAKAPHTAIRKAIADRDGRYYLADIPPGTYELVVNGKTFAISVEQVAIQELPPIRFKS
jgi:hypothetical protein